MLRLPHLEQGYEDAWRELEAGDQAAYTVVQPMEPSVIRGEISSMGTGAGARPPSDVRR